ncbi:hypothetical protein ACC691_39885, partial [Rhizobium johnstonii]
VPGNALLMSTVFIQLLLVVVLFASGALDFMLDLTAALSLVPFALAAGYARKTGGDHGGGGDDEFARTRSRG